MNRMANAGADAAGLDTVTVANNLKEKEA